MANLRFKAENYRSLNIMRVKLEISKERDYWCVTNMNATEYKKYHESFMENNHGSSLVHTFMCIFYTVQCSLKTSVKDQYQCEFKQYVYEYTLIVLPMILVHMVASNAIEALIFIDSLYLMYNLLKNFNKPVVSRIVLSKNNFRSKHILSVTCIRGLTYLITVFSILAVDFKQFPRFLAKTERFGYSLMDTGVGLFVLMSGLVHRDVSKKNYRLVIVKNLKFITILVILGVARFVSVRQLDYQEHVTEYGVHWNFFFTLAACKFISSIALFLFHKPLVLSIFTLILHELLLASSLQQWVFSDTARVTFIDANREGIASSLGYVSLYFFAVHLKRELTDTSILKYKLLIRLTLGSISLLFLSYFVNIAIPTSRTLANAGYSLYLSFILTSILTIMYILEVLSQDQQTIKFEVPLILSNINKNGLVYFLVANLTTGAINMSMQTLLVPAVATFFILNLYMFFTLTIIVYLNKKGISL